MSHVHSAGEPPDDNLPPAHYQHLRAQAEQYEHQAVRARAVSFFLLLLNVPTLCLVSFAPLKSMLAFAACTTLLVLWQCLRLPKHFRFHSKAQSEWVSLAILLSFGIVCVAPGFIAGDQRALGMFALVVANTIVYYAARIDVLNVRRYSGELVRSMERAEERQPASPDFSYSEMPVHSQRRWTPASLRDTAYQALHGAPLRKDPPKRKGPIMPKEAIGELRQRPLIYALVNGREQIFSGELNTDELLAFLRTYNQAGVVLVVDTTALLEVPRQIRDALFAARHERRLPDKEGTVAFLPKFRYTA